MLDVNGGEREENEGCSEPVYGGLQLRSHVLATGIGTLHFSAYMVNDTEHLEHQFLLVGLWFDALTFLRSFNHVCQDVCVYAQYFGLQVTKIHPLC